MRERDGDDRLAVVPGPKMGHQLQLRGGFKSGMAFVEDFSVPSVKLAGIAEVLGAVGLILPALTGIAP